VLPGVDPLAEAFDEPEGAVEQAERLLGVPADRTLRTMLAHGYPEESRPSSAGVPGRARKPVTEFAHEEHHGQR